MIVVLTQCFPPALGGIETLMGGLAAGAAEAGRTVRVFADGGRDARAEQSFDQAQAFTVRRFRGLKPFRRLLKAGVARPVLREAELVIADSWKSVETLGLLGALPPRNLRSWRLHCLAHGMELPELAPDHAKAQRIARAFAAADLIIANSRDTAARAAPFAGEAAIAVATPPLGPQAAAAPAAAAIAARLAAAAPVAGPLLVGLGRLEPRKGFDRVIEALTGLPEARFALAGDGPDRARLEALAAERGVETRVVFLGRVDEAEKAALLAAADLFCMPARAEGASVEGFGLVYLEAAWHGAPSLAGSEGGAADALLDGEIGYLCDGADPAAVAAALRAALADPATLAAKAARAAAHAKTQTWPRRLPDFLSPR